MNSSGKEKVLYTEISPVSLIKIFFGLMSPEIMRKLVTYTEPSGMSSGGCLNQDVKQEP